MGLRELAIKWGTDKAFFYAPFYEHLLANHKVSKMLEIGIGYPETMMDSLARAHWYEYKPGASLHMWAEYFPESEIYALDNKTDILINEGRIHSYYLDQSEPKTYLPAIVQIGDGFDLIIDDGSHDQADQLLARTMLFPLLRDGGIYITEDIADPDCWPEPCEYFSNVYGKAAICWTVK